MFWTKKLRNILKSGLPNEEGQDLVEYALILVFATVVCVIGVTTLGNTVIQVYLNQVLGIFG